VTSLSCLVCGVPSAEQPLHTLRASDWPERFSIVTCPVCGVGRTLPVPADLGPYYYGTDLAATMHREPSRIFGRAQAILLRREVRRVTGRSDPGTVLDIGCGAGMFTLALRRAGPRVVAIDTGPTPPAALAGVPDVPYRRIDFDRGTIESLDADGPYTVVLRHVLEHVRDPAAFLARLRDGGGRRFYVVVPDAGSRECRLLGAAWYLWDPPRHLWHFTAAALATLCRRVGLTVVATGGDVIPNLAPCVYRALRVRGWPAWAYAPFGPKTTLTALAGPLNLLLGANVRWVVAERLSDGDVIRGQDTSPAFLWTGAR
jgi:SAM-dependent methyltransferase